MKSIETKAKSLHEAIEEAVAKLGVPQEDLTIEILEQGGMFKKACIRATVKESAATPKELPAPKREEPKPEKFVESKREEPKPVKKPEPKIERPVETEHKPCDVGAIKFAKTLEFVKKLLELMENDAKVEGVHTDTGFNINVTGDNIGRLIGKGGSNLNAFQTLVSSIAISNANGEGKRVYINIGDYREKHGDTLLSMAQKKAEHVKATGRYVKLEPMNARDRAIIHTALQGVEGIKTYSTGKDPFRCLCIAPADKTERPEHDERPVSTSDSQE